MKQHSKIVGRLGLGWLVAALAAGLPACSSEDDAEDPAATGGQGGADDGSGAAGGQGGAADGEGGAAGSDGAGARRYAVMSLVSTAESSSAYVSIVPTLDEGELGDLSKSLELADAAYLFGTGSDSRFYVLRESAVLSAYDVTAAGTFEEGPSVSFFNHGVAAGRSERSVVFVSETKAYLLDDVSLQAIAWNPTTMAITSTIDLSELGKEGWVTYFDYRPKQRGAQLVLPAYYLDENFSASPTEAAVAFIDTATDAVTVARDTRCGGFSTSALTASGDLYVASDPYLDALHRTAGEAASPPGCLLRVRAGETRFDPDFFVTISDIAEDFGGGIVPGHGTHAYLRVYDEEVEAVTAETTAIDLYARAAWRWWRIDTADVTTAEPVALPPGAGTLRVFEVDGRAYATDASADYSTTTLVDMSQAEGPRPGLTVPGNVAGVLRVR